MGTHVNKAIKQLENDIERLEKGILEVIKVIGEKREQLESLELLIVKDRVCYYGMHKSEDYFKCSNHKVVYPRGAKCPQCEK